MPAYFAVGVQAYTSSISNIAPPISLALAEAGLAHDFARLDALMRKYVHPLYALRDRMRALQQRQLTFFGTESEAKPATPEAFAAPEEPAVAPNSAAEPRPKRTVRS